MRSFANAYAVAAAMILLPAALFSADVDTKFHNAPAQAQALKNPYTGQEDAQAGYHAPQPFHALQEVERPFFRFETEHTCDDRRTCRDALFSTPLRNFDTVGQGWRNEAVANDRHATGT